MSSSIGALHPGSLLADHYRILSEIGQGGFATVYKAQDLDRRKVVAIKQITLSQLSPQEMIEVTDSYNREIMYLSRLRHEHLPLIYDHFTDPENWYVVMDYIEGETLDNLLAKARQGRFPVAKVLGIGITLCKVLQYLHTRSSACAGITWILYHLISWLSRLVASRRHTHRQHVKEPPLQQQAQRRRP